MGKLRQLDVIWWRPLLVLLSEAWSNAFLNLFYFYIDIFSSDKPVLFGFLRNVSEILSDLCLKYLQISFSFTYCEEQLWTQIQIKQIIPEMRF